MHKDFYKKSSMGVLHKKTNDFRYEEREKEGIEMVSYSVFRCIKGIRTRGRNCCKYLDTGRKLINLCMFSHAIDGF